MFTLKQPFLYFIYDKHMTEDEYYDLIDSQPLEFLEQAAKIYYGT